MLAARKVPRRAEVDRGPPGEPDVGGPGPARARQRPDGVRRRRHDPRGRHRPRPGRRRLPDAVPGADRRGRRHVLPRAVPGAEGQLQLQVGVLQHRRAHRLPRTLAVRVARPRDAARHRRPPAWTSTRSSCAAATSCAATRCRTPTPTACRTTTSPRRDLRAGRQDPRLRGLPRGAGGRAGAGPLPRAWASRPTSSRPAPATGHLRHRGLRRSGSSRRARSTCTSPAARRGNSLETTVVQLTADALGADIDDVSTIQGDTAVTPFGAGTQGSRSGSMTAGAVDEAGRSCASSSSAIAAHRLGGRRGRHRAGRIAGLGARAPDEVA